MKIKVPEIVVQKYTAVDVPRGECFLYQSNLYLRGTYLDASGKQQEVGIWLETGLVYRVEVFYGNVTPVKNAEVSYTK